MSNVRLAVHRHDVHIIIRLYYRVYRQIIHFIEITKNRGLSFSFRCTYIEKLYHILL